MKVIIAEGYKEQKDQIEDLFKNFVNKGKAFNEGERNSIKIFELSGKNINIKSFKIPNAVNKIAYKFFRKSKAERSFRYAQLLTEKGIGTPQPVAFAEETWALGFGKSYYASEHLESELTYRELVTQPDYPNHEEILRAFTRFTFFMHENKVEFLDHSPGNTLIKHHNGKYEFFLVDLNRMNFREMDLEARMKNFSRLTPKKEMLQVMANEYAKCMEKPEAEIFEKMWFYTTDFQEKFHRKQRWKKKFKK
ncbi:Kdo domain containing protein [Antarcticibacterium arcticum]|uniref:Kdo domain containing protein n=1 Tax=Antarcticibacterium arcticum TaxID=2585771 RepID=A0A5B8YHN1_9FLAO|nr:lipopolysaccharide kinase InaA family protein [Antarcticibacterium arcticum]QED37440.1 Kdo domain containing protein [Antarcticibacterium arcticum]